MIHLRCTLARASAAPACSGFKHSRPLPTEQMNEWPVSGSGEELPDVGLWVFAAAKWIGG